MRRSTLLDQMSCREIVVQLRIGQTTCLNRHPKLCDPLCMKRNKQEYGKTLVVGEAVTKDAAQEGKGKKIRTSRLH
jgi:hypothetical protein